MTELVYRPKGLYFEDFEIGVKLRTAGRTITEADIVTFAGLSGDFNQIHTNAEYAAGDTFGKRVAHGLLVQSIATGLAVQRVSTRPRNAKNAPDSLDRYALAGFERLKASGGLADSTTLVVENLDGTRRLYVPILTGPFCLTCHGDQESLKPELRKILTQRYPDDRATGYAPGDLRGAIRVAEHVR